jgi:hypothetical protein
LGEKLTGKKLNPKAIIIDDVSVCPIDTEGVQYLFVNTALVGYMKRDANGRSVTIHQSWCDAAKVKLFVYP